jgi:heme ABC exporter ATP-binding subunit CcmA
MLEARGLVRSYGPVRALDGCSISCAAGETVAVTGPNGAGKSTLLKVLVGLLRPDQGDVTIEGADLRANLPDIRSKISYLGHATALYDDLTALESVEYAWALGGMPRSNAHEKALPALKDFGLEHRANDPVCVLSAGMRRRLALAIHLAEGRPNLILDEPFANLDEGGKQVLRQALAREAKEGRSVVLVVHDIALLEGVKHRRFHLVEGKEASV